MRSAVSPQASETRSLSNPLLPLLPPPPLHVGKLLGRGRSSPLLLPILPLSPLHPGKRKVFWQNLREEPLVFINGQPFVVRESDQPFSNLEYTGE